MIKIDMQYFGGRGASGGSSSGGLPETFSEIVSGRKVENGKVSFSNGQSYPISSFYKPSSADEKSTAAKAAKATGHDASEMVIAEISGGKAYLPRNVAQKAVEQRTKMKANYSANMKRNVKGYEELKSAHSHSEDEYYKQRSSISSGSGKIYKAKETGSASLEKKYPRAKAYIYAEAKANSNYNYRAAGEKAMKTIRMGGSYSKAIKTMEREIKAETSRHYND